MLSKVNIIISLLMLILVSVANPASYWTFKKEFDVPYHSTGSPNYIAVDGSGTLYYTTLWTYQTGSSDSGITCVVKVSNPLNDATRSFYAFDSATFDVLRGYLGVAMDSEQRIYISAENGMNKQPRFIKRFLPGATGIDSTFFGSGIRDTGFRVVGLTVETWTTDVDGKGIRMFISDLDNAKVKAIHLSDGSWCGTSPWSNMFTGSYPRDIDIDNDTHKLYVMKNGNVIQFTPDTSQNLDGYTQSTLVNNGNDTGYMYYGSQGICFDKYHNQIIYSTSFVDSTLRVVDTLGVQQQVIYGNAAVDSSSTRFTCLSDAALARIDGMDYLFIANYYRIRIAIYKWGPVMEWSDSLQNLPPAATIQFTARGGSGTYIWSCSNYAVGTVDSTGLFTALNLGSCTVTVTDPLSGSDISDIITVYTTHAPLATEEVVLALPRFAVIGELFE
jgi:hypothetical protein